MLFHTVISSLTPSLYLRNNASIPRGPIWEFVSEQYYLPHDKNLCLWNYFGKRPSARENNNNKKKWIHDSDNKTLITALLGGWMRKQRSKELSLEHVLEQAVGIDCNVMQRLVVWDTQLSWLPGNESGFLQQPWLQVVPEWGVSGEERDSFLIQTRSVLGGIYWVG